MARFERKICLEDYTPARIESMLRMLPAGLREAHPPRWVNSVYLDSPSLGTAQIHANGASKRAKLRVRWYGADRGPVEKPVLELKIKKAHLGTKDLWPLVPFDYQGALDVRKLVFREGVQPDPELMARLAGSLPVLLVRYHRKYYLSADKKYRLTLDANLQFQTVSGRRYGWLDRFEERRKFIVEVKYNAEDDPGASEICGALPFRVRRYSKYIAGIQRLSGHAAD